MHYMNQDKSHAMAKIYYSYTIIYVVGIGNPSPFSTSSTQFMTFTASLKQGYRHDFVLGGGLRLRLINTSQYGGSTLNL